MTPGFGQDLVLQIFPGIEDEIVSSDGTAENGEDLGLRGDKIGVGGDEVGLVVAAKAARGCDGGEVEDWQGRWLLEWRRDWWRCLE